MLLLDRSDPYLEVLGQFLVPATLYNQLDSLQKITCPRLHPRLIKSTPRGMNMDNTNKRSSTACSYQGLKEVGLKEREEEN